MTISEFLFQWQINSEDLRVFINNEQLMLFKGLASFFNNEQLQMFIEDLRVSSSNNSDNT